jgi:hypothetical protein
VKPQDSLRSSVFLITINPNIKRTGRTKKEIAEEEAKFKRWISYLFSKKGMKYVLHDKLSKGDPFKHLSKLKNTGNYEYSNTAKHLHHNRILELPNHKGFYQVNEQFIRKSFATIFGKDLHMNVKGAPMTEVDFKNYIWKK